MVTQCRQSARNSCIENVAMIFFYPPPRLLPFSPLIPAVHLASCIPAGFLLYICSALLALYLFGISLWHVTCLSCDSHACVTTNQKWPHVHFSKITFQKFLAFQSENNPRTNQNWLWVTIIYVVHLCKWCNTFSVNISFGCSLLLAHIN